MSAVLDIYDEIAGMVVGDVTARSLETAKLAVRAGDVPVRILIPRTEGDLTFVAIGTLNKISWTIRDLCLWAPVVSGTGIQQFAGEMVAYMKNYIIALKALRSPTSQSHITGVRFALGAVPWSSGDFWAIDTTLEVEEYV